LRWPQALGRWAAGAAGVAWVGAFAGFHLGGRAVLAAVAVAVVAVSVASDRPWSAPARLLSIVVVAAALSGVAADNRIARTLDAAAPAGNVELAGVVVEDPRRYGESFRFVFQPSHVLVAEAWRPLAGAPLAVVGDDESPQAGDTVRVDGVGMPRPTVVRGDPVAGVIKARDVTVVSGSTNPMFIAGNELRARVSAGLERHQGDPAAALLAGFLIGDTSALDPTDTEALRRAGLTHYVAVSGSNVALFLAAWWLVAAPFAWNPRVRAGIGLVGLAVFVVVTRWEPSVVRAATMAGLVLGARIAGFPLDAWAALGGAVTLLLLVSGDLAVNVGFQLSAAATAGVLVGAGMFYGRRPRWVWATLGATMAAQAAVVPLLMSHFGGVPLLAPIANLLAAPLVTLSTALGGLGVLTGVDVLVSLGLRVGRVVLGIAHAAAGWPQLEWVGVGMVGMLALMVARRSTRAVALSAMVVAAAAMAMPAGPPAVATMTVLDVGQGDAVLLQDPDGWTVLVDGGRDPQVLNRALRDHGVRRIHLLVATHGDFDHVGGFVGLLDQFEVGQLWVPDQPDFGDVVPELLIEAAEHAVPVVRQRAGSSQRLGAYDLAALGPRRRYADSNNGSIVLWVTVAGSTVLLPGDIGAVAQNELETVRPDVMLIPHHGSSTTDLDWLAANVPTMAVVSVGEDNTYGHPAPEVMQVLDNAGVPVWLTSEHGDIVVPFG
jgi:competence protein ComEC